MTQSQKCWTSPHRPSTLWIAPLCLILLAAAGCSHSKEASDEATDAASATADGNAPVAGTDAAPPVNPDGVAQAAATTETPEVSVKKTVPNRAKKHVAIKKNTTQKVKTLTGLAAKGASLSPHSRQPASSQPPSFAQQPITRPNPPAPQAAPQVTPQNQQNNQLTAGAASSDTVAAEANNRTPASNHSEDTVEAEKTSPLGLLKTYRTAFIAALALIALGGGGFAYWKKTTQV
ncbi:hypothetical protein WDW37_10680 [Bdellovibrionota bacterium FG-1]